MKILVSIIYLLVLFIWMKSAALSTRMTVASVVKNKKVLITRSILLSWLAILTFYFAFWLLTGVFPIYFILLLLITSFLAMGIYEIAGAVGGFTIKEKKKILRIACECRSPT